MDKKTKKYVVFCIFYSKKGMLVPIFFVSLQSETYKL